MSRLICIAYQPGAFGSFLGWVVDRFSAARKQYQPPVVDDPLQDDGSSRNYASFCKVKRNDDFIEGLYEARRTDAVHGYQIYAGWPQGIGEDLTRSINLIASNMSTFDRMFVIECTKPEDHFIRYIRNEAMMDKVRWYGMMEADDDGDVSKRLASDIEAGGLPDGYRHTRVCRIGFSDLLRGNPGELFDRIFDYLETRPCDKPLFLDTITRMRSMQGRYMDRLDLIRFGNVDTPVDNAIHNWIRVNGDTPGSSERIANVHG